MTIEAVLLTALSALVMAEPRLTGPASVQAGALCVIRLDAVDDARVLWRLIGPDEEHWIALERNRVLVFASPVQGVYRALCAVATTQDLWLLEHRFTVEANTPKPPGPPSPPPDPGPLDRTLAALLSSVPDANRVQNALRIADALTAVANAARQGVYANARQARESLRATVRGYLRDSATIDAWTPVSDAIDAYMDQLYAAGRLQTLQDYAAVWLSVASTLRKLVSGTSSSHTVPSCTAGACRIR